jgi:hypothetical protein
MNHESQRQRPENPKSTEEKNASLRACMSLELSRGWSQRANKLVIVNWLMSDDSGSRKRKADDDQEEKLRPTKRLRLDDTTLKWCATCRKHLDRSWFSSHKSTWDGKQHTCKPCHAARRRVFKPAGVRRVQNAIEEQGGKCLACGRQDLPFDFAHRQRGTVAVHSRTGRRIQLKDIRGKDFPAELAKGRFLCVLCHHKESRTETKAIHDAKPLAPKQLYERRRAEANRQMVNTIKMQTGACAHCAKRVVEGETCLFEFDHIDPETKLRSVSSLMYCSLKTIMREIAKCQLLCVACHRKRSAEQTVKRQTGKFKIDSAKPPSQDEPSVEHSSESLADKFRTDTFNTPPPPVQPAAPAPVVDDDVIQRARLAMERTRARRAQSELDERLKGLRERVLSRLMNR